MTNRDALEKIREMKVSLVNVVGFNGEFVEIIEKAVEKQIEEEEPVDKWRKILGVVIPSGDSVYNCPNCCGGTHINGGEFGKDWNYCPDCGSRLEY